MTGYQNRHIPFISQSLYGITHLCNSLGIKPIDRFIKDQEIRLPDPWSDPGDGWDDYAYDDEGWGDYF